MRSPPAGERLSLRGRAWRMAATAAVGVALVGGSLWGSNDHFPFGPFSMYATARRTDGYVRQTRVEAVDADGRRFQVDDSSTGLRRAEIEGQIHLFRRHPEQLGAVAEAYSARHPTAAPVVQVDIVQWRYQLDDGRPSGEVAKETILSWPDETTSSETAP